jgi:hypothetical protein
MRPMRNRKTLAQSIDRRKFLLGAAGSMLALPMLETYAPERRVVSPWRPPSGC